MHNEGDSLTSSYKIILEPLQKEQESLSDQKNTGKFHKLRNIDNYVYKKKKLIHSN